MTQRRDAFDPLPFTAEWPSLTTVTGRVDIHSLAAFFAMETKLTGDYYEFGVGKGRSLVSAIRAEDMYKRPGSHFHLYDTFEGLPEIEGRDRDFGQFNKGDFAFGIDAVKRFLTDHQCQNLDRLSFHRGGYDETLKGAPPERPAAIVHIDCDLYESTKLALPFIAPRLVAGTVVLFDDWNLFAASDRHGERAAVREWLAVTPDIKLEPYAAYGWCGHAFITQR